VNLKGHPKDRPLEPDDPMMLKAACVSGAPELMLDCLVEEYAHMGWDRNAILRLFDDPFFLATRSLKDRFGEQGLRDRVDQVLARCGVIRCTTPHRGPQPKEENRA
jgi:hypothetical protein